MTAGLLFTVSFSVLACGHSPEEADGTGGTKAGSGGHEHSDGGRSSSGDDDPSLHGGEGGEESTTDDQSGLTASGGEGNAPLSPAPPRWVAFNVTGGGAGHYPLVLARTDGALDPIVVTADLPPRPHYSFSPDGSQLLYVDAYCCGSVSNGAYLVPLDDDGLGEKERVHEELTGGASVRYARFSASGDVIVVQFVDAALHGHYAFRSTSGGLSFQPLTLPATWGSSNLDPVWSPDGRRLIIVEGSPLGHVAETVYLIDFTADPKEPEVHLLAEGPEHEQPLDAAVWSPDSRFVAVSGTDALYLLDAEATDREFVDLSTATDATLGGGGAQSGEESGREFGGYLPQFSPDSRRLAWIAFQDGPWAGASRLLAIALDVDTFAGDESVSAHKQLVYDGDNAPHSVQANYVSWAPNSRAIFFGADTLVDGRVDMYRATLGGNANSWTAEPVAFLQEGETFNGHAVLRDGVLILAGREYTPHGLYFTAFADDPTERTTLFEYSQDAEPGWAEFAGLPSRGERGAFFSSYEYDSLAYGSKNAQLFHIGTDGAMHLLVGPLEGEGYFGLPGSFSPNEHWFVFNADVNGDFFKEVMVTEADGDTYGEPQIIASLSEAQGATAQGFVWQP